MSLQVWLPLNGNLNNQGLSDIAFTNEGNISVDTSGKIGSCYSRATKQTTGRIISNSKVLFDKSLSICCWAYVSDCVGDTANGLVTIHSHEHNSNVGINVKQYSSTDYRICCNTGTGSGRTFHEYYGTTNIKNKWSHLTLTYDNVSKVLKLYVNGNCEYTLNNYTNYAISDNIILFDWSTTYNYPNYRPACKMNDVRIYDHCLSSKEIKEISKGLICHYKLADPYIESTTNLYSGWSSTCYNGSTSKYSYGTATDMYYDILDNIIKVRMGTSNLNAWPFVFFDNITPPSNGEYRSLSFDYYPTIKNEINFYSYNTSGTITWIANGIKGTGGDIPVNIGSWNHISVTIKNTGSSSSGFGYMKIGLEAHTSSTSNYWLFKNIQIESKDHSTGYVGAGTSRNSDTEYDVSGYSYNGTISESLTCVPDSPRYDRCYYFNSASKRITLPVINMSGFSNSFSISWWGKAPSYSATGLMYWGFSNGNRLNYYSGLYCNTGDGSNNPYYRPNTATTISTPSVDTWHHFVMVGDGSSNKLYMDGELYGVAKTYRGITGSTIVINGWDSSTSYKTNGYISDFRIYSTALSASDIKELYNTSASVDKNGNMYAYEFKEV